MMGLGNLLVLFILPLVAVVYLFTTALAFITETMAKRVNRTKELPELPFFYEPQTDAEKTVMQSIENLKDSVEAEYPGRRYWISPDTLSRCDRLRTVTVWVDRKYPVKFKRNNLAFTLCEEEPDVPKQSNKPEKKVSAYAWFENVRETIMEINDQADENGEEHFTLPRTYFEGVNVTEAVEELINNGFMAKEVEDGVECTVFPNI